MPAAAALLERILTEGYTPGMARAAGVARASMPEPVTYHPTPLPLYRSVAPQKFAMPRPERPKGHYARILEWSEELDEEPEAEGGVACGSKEEERQKTGTKMQKTDAHESGYERNKYEYLHHGGAYVQRVLAQGRILASFFQSTAEDVPQWPPVPMPVRVSRQAVPDASHALPKQEFGSHASALVGCIMEDDGFVWPLPPRECMTSPTDDLPSALRPQPHPNAPSILASASRTVGAETADSRLDREPTCGWPTPVPQRAQRSRTFSTVGTASSSVGRNSPASSMSTESPLPITPPRWWTGLVSSPRNPNVGVIGDGRPSASEPKQAVTADSPTPTVPRRSEVDASRGKSWSPVVEDDIFSVDGGGWRSLTPTDDDGEMEEVWEEGCRGRSPTPKWSMFWAL